MNKVIKLNSRYKDVETSVELINNNKGLIVSTGDYTRVGHLLDEGIQFIDFEGGPMISLGSIVNGLKVKSIKASYVLEFE